MASNNPIRHFADAHPLEQTQYRHDEAGLCNICQIKLAGLSCLTCYSCNTHLHSACARYFPETISFFAHPSHTLKLRRSPGRICDICRGDCPRESFVYSCTGCGFDVHPLCSKLPCAPHLPETISFFAHPSHTLKLRRSPGRICDICREDCPRESFVYSCTGCGFDVHPVCSNLPERLASPLDPSHELCMFSSESPGGCSACHHPLPRWQWHYIGSSLKLHIACAIDKPTGVAVPAVYGAAGNYGGGAVAQQGISHGGAVSQRSLFGNPANPVTGPAGYNPGIQGYGHVGQAGSYYYAPAPPIHGIYYSPAMPGGGGGYGASGSGQQSSFHNPSSLMSVIARFLFRTAISTVANDLFSELLSESMN